MPHIKFQTSPKSGGNSGSCSQVLNYLEKEGKGFFDANRDDLSNDLAKDTIEHRFYKKGVKKTDSKFYSVVFSFSKEELKGKTDKELIEFAKSNFANTYCDSIKGKDQDPSSIAWVAKLEKQRKYKGDHPDVKAGLAKSGQLKAGDNRHIHFIVARKTLDDKKVSPMSNHFRKTNKGAVKSGFDQDKFKIDIEQRFDNHFAHNRDKLDQVGERLKPYRPDLVRQNDFQLDQIKERIDERLNEIEPQVKHFNKAVKDKKLNTAITAFNRLNEFFKRLFYKKIKTLEKEVNQHVVPLSRGKGMHDHKNIKRDQEQNKNTPPLQPKKNKDKGRGM